MSVSFRLVKSADEAGLADLFADIDETFFRPHDFTADEARVIASLRGRDVYALLIEDGRAVAYGMLRGFDEGYAVPSLGIAVRTSAHGRGLGRDMMAHLHAEAARRGATVVRLRVHPDNLRARTLYESLGYAYAGQDRGELVMIVGLSGGAKAYHGADGTTARTITGSLLDCDSPEWEMVLRTVPHDFYHLPAYNALCAAQEDASPFALYVTDGFQTMLLPLLARPIPGGGVDATSPYGYPGPVGTGSDDPIFLQLAIVAGLQVLREAGFVSAFVRFHPLLNPEPPQGIGTLVVHGDTVSIDLTRPAEEQWGRLRKNHRRDITRALRLGYTARIDEDLQHLGDFERLYQNTMQRRHASAFYAFDRTYFSGLLRALGERLHLCLVEKDGAIAAAGLFVTTDGIVQYHLSGTDEKSSAIQPTKLMMDFVSGWARDRGERVLHLGGGVGGAADSLLHFKAGFSPLRSRFATLRAVIDESEYNRLVHSSNADLDPEDRFGFFPLYRRPLESAAEC